MLLVLLAPAAFALTAVSSWFQPGLRPVAVKNMSRLASLITLVVAVAGGIFLYKSGPQQAGISGFAGLGFSIRLDALSMLMLGMIALLAYVIVRYSQNYLDGDGRQGVFLGRLSATIASVILMVTAGNLSLLVLAWFLTSFSLQRLLVFYPERPGAVIAARKKFIAARLSDACLLFAAILIWQLFGTGDLGSIFAQLELMTEAPAGLEAAAILLVLAALFKSAQFPAHGWLIEVMETPTPVSALLHAGLLNAGPFLIVRMAHLMEHSSYAPLLLIGLGGLSALFGSVVYLTQPAVKTALGYSSIAHMGFSLLVCGLGLYPAAMLHLVAHSFYKAHSFLSSGSVIEVLRADKVAAAPRRGQALRILFSMLLAGAVYAGFVYLWGIDPIGESGLMVIGAVIVLGMTRIFGLAIDARASMALVLRAAAFAVLVAAAFFGLEAGMHSLLAAQLPELMAMGTVRMVLAAALLLVFAGVVFIQLMAPSIVMRPAYQALVIHLRNGLYINHLFDVLVGAWSLSLRNARGGNWQRIPAPVQQEALEASPQHETQNA